MIAAASNATANRRLEQLYEISKLFAAFDVVENTLDAALKVIADKLPLERAILIEAVTGRRRQAALRDPLTRLTAPCQPARHACCITWR